MNYIKLIIIIIILIQTFLINDKFKELNKTLSNINNKSIKEDINGSESNGFN